MTGKTTPEESVSLNVPKAALAAEKRLSWLTTD